MDLRFYKGQKGDFTCQQADSSIIPTSLASPWPTCIPGDTFFLTSNMVPHTKFQVLKNPVQAQD